MRKPLLIPEGPLRAPVTYVSVGPSPPALVCLTAESTSDFGCRLRCRARPLTPRTSAHAHEKERGERGGEGDTRERLDCSDRLGPRRAGMARSMPGARESGAAGRMDAAHDGEASSAA